MSYVRNFVLICSVSYIVYLSWSIILAKFIKAEFEPIFLVVFDVDVIVSSAVDVSSVIA